MKRYVLGLAAAFAVSGCGTSSAPLVPQMPAASQRQAAHGGSRATWIYFGGYGTASSGASGPGVVGVYSAMENRDVPPPKIVVGSKTTLVSPTIAWYAPSEHKIWSCDFNVKHLSAFATSRWGNVAPTETLAIGPPVQSCSGLAFDDHGVLYVGDLGGKQIVRWPAGARGHTPPAAVIAGNNTTLDGPSALAFDQAGNLLVTDQFASALLQFSATAKGNAAPRRVWNGPASHLAGPTAIAVDSANGLIYVANERNSTITVYSEADTAARPRRTIGGNRTKLLNPYGVAVDAAGYVYVGNCPQNQNGPVGNIAVFAPGAHGNVAPVQIIGGPNDGLSCVDGLTVY